MNLVDGQAPPFKFMSCLQRISNAAIARGDKIFFQKPDYFQPGIGLGLAMVFRETPKSKNSFNDWVEHMLDGDWLMGWEAGQTNPDYFICQGFTR